ncbi:MAG TPA: amidase [Vicinamibacterales bacterium]|nr:amidase [Vicinamibacterales bacterium]
MTMPATMAEAAAAMRAGRISATDLVDLSLSAIARHNPGTHAFIRVDADTARASARQLDDERAAGGDRGPLHGLPISLKDLIDVAGAPTTGASRVFADRVAESDAPITQRLRAAGAVLIGKTNLHEFALGTTSEDSAYGAVLHPRDHTRSAGGSSGGSAVAVSTGMGLASVGTDTGGSIRIPAAVCGIVGLKPSRGDVPLTGVIPLSMTFDHAGPLARSVQDAAWLWSILAGRPIHTVKPVELAGLRLGTVGGYFADPMEPEVRAAFEHACEVLRAAGVEPTAVTFDLAPRITEAYVNVVLSEGAAWHAPWLDDRAADYSPTVHGRLTSGRDIPAVAYLHARQECELMRCAVDELLSSMDALIMPTLPIVAPISGQANVNVDGTEMPVRSAMLKHTQLFNMTGHPAITLPLKAEGLPVGLQLVGPSGATTRLLDIAAACETVLCR